MILLERRCRLLLRAYPAGYRRERGAELVATMLDMTPASRSWPSWRDSADLISHGIRLRITDVVAPGLRVGLAAAGPVALAACAGLAGYLLAAEWTAPDLLVGYRRPGPFPTIGPVLWAAVLLVAVTHVALPRPDHRAAGVAALAVGAVLPAAATLTGYARPPLHLLLPILMLLAIGVAGTWHRPTRGQRIAAGTGVLAAAALAGAVGGDALTGAGRWMFAGPAESATAAVAATAFGGTLVVGVARALLTPGDVRALWGALPLLAPAAAAASDAAWSTGHTGLSTLDLLPLQTMAAVVVVAVVAGRARRHDGRTGAPPGQLRTAGTVVIGFAAGASLFVWATCETPAPLDPRVPWEQVEPFGPFATLGPLAYPLWIAAAAGWVVLPARWTRALVGAALVTTVALPVIDGRTDHAQPADILVGMLAAFGTVALASAQRPADVRRAAGGMLALVAGTVAALAAGAATLESGRPVDTLVRFTVFAAVVPAGAAVALAWPTLRTARGAALPAPVTVVLAAAGWMAVTLLPHTARWQVAVMAAVLVGLVVGAVAAPTRAPEPSGRPGHPTGRTDHLINNGERHATQA